MLTSAPAARLASPTHSLPITPGFYQTIWRLLSLKKRKGPEGQVGLPTHFLPTTPGFYWTIWGLLSAKKRKDPDADVSAGEVYPPCAADHVGASLTLLLVLGVSSLGTRNCFFQRHEALVRQDKVGCICGLRGGIKDRAGLGNTQES